MLFATSHPIKANKIALLATHRALYFDSQTDISDAHVSVSSYLSKIKSARAWGNSASGVGSEVTLSPMSGVKDNFFYPARSARLVNNSAVSGGYAAYSAAQTPDAILARYFTVYDADTPGYQWSAGMPVFDGRFGRSADSSESYYWPSNCMLIFPEGMRNVNTHLQTYSSKVGNQYARNTDPFWGTYSGYDAGFNTATLSLVSWNESGPYGYSYISQTTTPVQTAPLHNSYAVIDHIAFVRTVGMTYSANGLNQFSSTSTPQNGNGVSGYDRTSPDAFPPRVPISGKANTADAILTACMMAFQVNGLKYLVRCAIGQDKDMTQSAAIPVAATATLSLVNTQFFPDKSLTQM